MRREYMKRGLIIVLCALTLVTFLLAGCKNKGAVGLESDDKNYESDVTVRVGGLKGPTSLGLLFMQKWDDSSELEQDYDFMMATQADELLPLIVKGELDIALVPANVASVLYNKTEGGISVIDINTLGVLYMVSGDDQIESIEDLKGKTVYLTGKGTTPEYVLKYVLNGNGLSEEDVNLEYKSEATEVAAVLASDSSAIGLLPQPFVTAACAQNEKLKVVLDMSKQWDAVSSDASGHLVTGVTIVRNEFLNNHEKAVRGFLADHSSSVDAVNSSVDEAATLAVEAGIIAKEPLAKKAIPNCSITYIDGKQMQEYLSGYLQVLFDADQSSVGGKLPGEGFYYTE